jgi:hypothetical protein
VNSAADSTSLNTALTLSEAVMLTDGELPYSSLSAAQLAQVSGVFGPGLPVSIQFAPSLSGATITLATPNNPNDPNGASEFLINGPVSIIGPTSSTPITIARSSSAAPFRLFDVTSTGTLDLENLTLRGGLAQGGQGQALFSPSSPSLNSGSGGGGAGMGGAIYNTGVVTVENSTFAGNTAQGGGSAALVTSGTQIYGVGGGPNGGLATRLGGFGGGGGAGYGGFSGPYNL